MSKLETVPDAGRAGTRNLKFFERVYGIVQEIPAGKVATYGQIANLVQNSKFKVRNYKPDKKITPRVIGWALHVNRDKNVPCHRVVDRNGRLAPNFGLGRWREQRKRLLAEGVKFNDERHAALSLSFWRYPENQKTQRTQIPRDPDG